MSVLHPTGLQKTDAYVPVLRSTFAFSVKSFHILQGIDPVDATRRPDWNIYAVAYPVGIHLPDGGFYSVEHAGPTDGRA